MGNTSNRSDKKGSLSPINWRVKGNNWTFDLMAPPDSDPMEIFTQCIEQLWGGIEQWKFTGSHQGVLTIEGEEPVLGVVLMLENSNMKSYQEHLVIATSVVLANAGLYNDSTRLEKSWERLPIESRIQELLGILEENDENQE